jgi:hypothetical protein
MTCFLLKRRKRILRTVLHTKKAINLISIVIDIQTAYMKPIWNCFKQSVIALTEDNDVLWLQSWDFLWETRKFVLGKKAINLISIVIDIQTAYMKPIYVVGSGSKILLTKSYSEDWWLINKFKSTYNHKLLGNNYLTLFDFFVERSFIKNFF